MPIKLQVVRENDADKEPADYLFEQDVIQLGRSSDNDLTLPDQEISQHHAEVVQADGEYKLRDLNSKNHTFVHGRKLEEGEMYTLKSGDVFSLGGFQVEFVPLFMPSSEQTALADESDEEPNPFERHARELKRALQGMVETYTYAPPDMRDSELKRTLTEVLDSRVSGARVGEHRVMEHFVDMATEDALAPSADATDATDAPAVSDTESVPAHVDDVLEVLLEAVARMTSIPRKFWREFSGNTVVHPPEKAFLQASSVEELRRHLLDDAVSDADRAERIKHLQEAVDTLVWHEVSLLSGYKAAVGEGSDALIDHLSPAAAYEHATGEGIFTKVFGSGDQATPIKALYRRWKLLNEKSKSEIEKELFRPAFTEAYLDRMADSWGVQKDEITEVRSDDT